MWTVEHNLLPWVFALIILSVVFYLLDRRNVDLELDEDVEFSGKTTIVGSKNFFWLAIVIISVFIEITCAAAPHTRGRSHPGRPYACRAAPWRDSLPARDRRGRTLCHDVLRDNGARDDLDHSRHG